MSVWRALWVGYSDIMYWERRRRQTRRTVASGTRDVQGMTHVVGERKINNIDRSESADMCSKRSEPTSGEGRAAFENVLKNKFSLVSQWQENDVLSFPHHLAVDSVMRFFTVVFRVGLIHSHYLMQHFEEVPSSNCCGIRYHYAGHGARATRNTVRRVELCVRERERHFEQLLH